MSLQFRALAGGVVIVLTLAQANAQEIVLHTFQGGSDGANPNSRLLYATNGVIYGTTSGGGGGTACPGGCGTVFQLTPAGDEAVIYAFQGGADGTYPYNENLVSDASGDLFGVTLYGGAYGNGVVFEVTPPQGGETAWKEKPVYSFPGGKDGAVPQTYLLMGAGGVLYGTASAGGSTGCGGGGCGIVFSLTPPANGHGRWKFKPLHTFRGGKGDGATPQAGPIADGAGNLYGDTSAGGGVGCGGAGCGTVYELSPPPQGQTAWHETVLHKFARKGKGQDPVGNLLLGPGGTLYGSAGGGVGTCGGPIIFGCGIDFALAPPAKAGGVWTETVIHTVKGKVDHYYDGSYPNGDFIAGPGGAILGASYGGGLPQFGGAVVELTPGGGGTWTETILYAFAGGNDGSGAVAGVTQGAGGVLYGVTVEGGAANLGTVYQLTP